MLGVFHSVGNRERSSGATQAKRVALSLNRRRLGVFTPCRNKIKTELRLPVEFASTKMVAPAGFEPALPP
jgi:hypothetical protein